VQLAENTQPVVVCNVSVSTSGSKGVQRWPNAPLHGDFDRFSIHKRIEGGATIGAAMRTIAANLFQYPQADRRGCNFVSMVKA